MKLRVIVTMILFIFLFFACSNPDSEPPPNTEKESIETVSEENQDEEVEDSLEVGAQLQEEEQLELSADVRFSGEMTLREDGIFVNVESNLPPGVRVSVRAIDNPFWGYPSSFLAIDGLTVEENGVVNGLLTFEHDNFWDRFLNVPIGLEISFKSISVPYEVENREEIIAFYGENGENFEGPFVVEE